MGGSDWSIRFVSPRGSRKGNEIRGERLHRLLGICAQPFSIPSFNSSLSVN